MKILKIILKVLILKTIIGLCVWGFIVAEKNGVFRIKDITVSIKKTEHIEVFADLKKQIENYLASNVGINTWDVNVSEIAKNLNQKEWIEQVRISRRLPSSLFVEVTPKKLNFIVSNTKSSFLPIAEDSTILPEIQLTKSPDLPILNGEDFIKEKKFRDSANDIFKALSDEGKFSKKTIAEIRMDNNKDFWVILMEGGLKVHLGRDSLKLKVARVNQVLNYLDNNEIQGRVIDADYSQKVLVKLRKQK